MAPSRVPWFPIDEAYLVGGWLESFFWGESMCSYELNFPTLTYLFHRSLHPAFRYDALWYIQEAEGRDQQLHDSLYHHIVSLLLHPAHFLRSILIFIVRRYLLATTHISLALTRLIQGFILYRDITGPIPYFANISVRLNVAKDYIYITNVSLMTYYPDLKLFAYSESSCSWPWETLSSHGDCTWSGGRGFRLLRSRF